MLSKTGRLIEAEELIDRHCQADHRNIRRLSDGEVRRLSQQLNSGWEIIDGKSLRQEFTFTDFIDAMVYVNDVAALADEEAHHPDIHIFGSRVVIELSTHSIDGLSENDFILARKIEMCC